MEKTVLISGGGIGGLALALGLAKKGFRSTVFEKTQEFNEVGAGIQLAPNAFHALDYLGVGDAAREIAVYIDNLRLMDAVSGEEISRISLGKTFRKRFQNPYAVVHRGELYGVLLKACKDYELVELRSSSEIVDYKQDSANVTAVLANGSRVNGMALIGADGLHSNIRKRLIGDGVPRISGHTTYRSVIPTEDMPEELRWNAATLWAGAKCHIVHYPLSDWKLFNLVATYHNNASEPIVGKPVSHDEVRKGFEHITELPRQIIEKGKEWKLWVLCDRDPVDQWVDGRVALLGDAAHPMLQYFAQGACMALEDAVAVSYVLEMMTGDIEDALLAYQEIRKLRTARVQLQSREIGNHIYHPAGVHAKLRNKIMSNRSNEEWYSIIDWLYNSNGIESRSY